MNRLGLFSLLLACSCLLGCDAKIERFSSNQVFSLTLARSESANMRGAESDVADVMFALFGTPSEPEWPTRLLPNTELVNIESLRRAAGNVSSEKDGTHLGLFREHCVVCHGISGHGGGPASQFQVPYPRDFRAGVFKWKLTDRSEKPTREDLRNLLVKGIPGTGMPSFSLLASEDLDALVDYVIYLAVRGEVERRLLVLSVAEMGYGGDKLAPEGRFTYTSDEAPDQVIVDTVQRVVQQWVSSKDKENQGDHTSSYPEGLDSDEAVERGRKWFHGKTANCVGCHGADGDGGIETLDYDDWTKEYTTKLGISPEDQVALQPFRDLGAHKPRPILPRKLRGGTLRGGNDPTRLFHLINQGIAGTPMPGVEIVEEGDGRGLTEDQIWELVSFLRAINSSY